jgi:hypothetical protein
MSETSVIEWDSHRGCPMAWIRTGRVGWRCAAAFVTGLMLIAADPASAAGTWTFEAGQPRGLKTLLAVSCLPTGWCAAVGEERDYDGGPARVYAETGDGATWTVAPSSGPPHESTLFSVSCVAPDWCQAVGTTYDGVIRTLIEHWNGRAWSRSSVLTGRRSLRGVSCVSRSFCMAVGGQSRGPDTSVPLVERWNGKQWSAIASPKKGSLRSLLTAVSCVSPTWCAAVGLYAVPAPYYSGSRTLVELWNGKTWRIVASPNTAGKKNRTVALNSVDCVSPTWCMAGGYGQRAGALIEHWNGRAWTLMGHPSDDAGAAGASVESVSCVSRTACVVVGYGLPFAERWNGTVWAPMSHVDDSQPVGPQFFWNVSCVSAAICKTVGDGAAIYTSG